MSLKHNETTKTVIISYTLTKNFIIIKNKLGFKSVYSMCSLVLSQIKVRIIKTKPLDFPSIEFHL